MVGIAAYNCITAAGEGVEPLLEALDSNAKPVSKLAPRGWRIKPQGLIYRWEELKSSNFSELSVQELLVKKLITCIEPFASEINSELGVIFASTKGDLEDKVWSEGSLEHDTLYPVLDAFLSQTSLTPKKSMCLSNACSSSHVAFNVARHWLTRNLVSQVLVLSADIIGPFIYNGFDSLRALSKTGVRPFSEDRDGLVLGDGAAAILLTATNQDINLIDSKFSVSDASLTYPKADTLSEALKTVCQNYQPDFVVAHGTATAANDACEKEAFEKVFPTSLPIITTKQATGHTMGASGAIDLIVACEKLKDGSSTCAAVSSLGFGGIHAASLIGVPSVTPLNEVAARDDESFCEFKELNQEVKVDFSIVPKWADAVERWYQLDGASFALVSAFANGWSAELPTPNAIILASPSASNEADQAFVNAGAMNPAKFVHTLPNVRSVALLQFLDWSGPVYCVQAGANTVQAAKDLTEDLHLAGAWIVSVFPKTLDLYEVKVYLAGQLKTLR